MKYVVKTSPGNKSGSIPAHHDIHQEGVDDSIVTVWGNLALAHEIADHMGTLKEAYGEKSA